MVADPTFWDELAEDYAAKPVEDIPAWHKKLEITKERLKSRADAVVLDIGCGTGSLALELAPHAGRVHALDLSPAMVAIGERKAAAAGVDNITFHTGPISSFDAIEPGSLDMLCAYSILHLVEDRSATLAMIHRLLKPGGVFISSTVCLGDSWFPYGAMLAVMRWAGKAPMVKIIPRDGLVEEMRAAGFMDAALVDVGAKDTVGFVVATKNA